jgi:hypothetical protein
MARDVVEETGQQPRASEGVTMHGAAEPRGLDAVPRSALFEGPFGRMFRNLPFVALDREALIALGKAMREQPGAGATDNPRIPAAYTYLGQFIDHDITFDPTSQLQRFNDPDALEDFRTPRYDLDSLYGRGPADSPYLYEWTDQRFRGVKLLAGRNPDSDVDGTPLTRQDLPRNEQSRALIGDPRNDENIIVSQLQLAFIKLHDRVVDRVKNSTTLTGKALLDEAQRRVRWHYQWMVVHDFLPRVCGADIVGSILKDEDAPTGPTIDLQFYSWESQPFMPVEFSVAAYRFGHSMVRPAYDLNANVREVPIFADSATPGAFEHLGGLRRLPEGWTIDWRFFVNIGGSRPQLSRRIDTRLAGPLFRLPPGLDAARNPLAVLNLRRGKALQLPSGQAVAGRMSVPVLEPGELGLDKLGLSPEHTAALTADTPLWYYILREAEVRHDGQHLGEVGGRIVAEVLIGLLAGDPSSYLRTQPTWKPDGGIPAFQPGKFTLGDLLKFATQ